MISKFLKLIKSEQFTKLLVYGFGQFFNLVTPLLVVPYIVFTCGEENFGKVAVGLAISFFLIVFVDYGSDLIGVREVSINRENPKELQRIFVTTYTSKLLILLVVLTFSIILFKTVPYFSADYKLFFFGLTILIGQFINPTWFLQGLENVKWITVINIVSKVFYASSIFLFILKSDDYVYVNFYWGLGMIAANSLVFILILKKYKISLYLVSKTEISHFLKKDFSMFSSQIFVALQLNTPVILISLFGSNLMAGQYKIVDQIIVIFKTGIFLFFNFVFPKICYLLEVDTKKALKNWKIYNGLLFSFVFVSMIFIYIFSYDIVAYFNPTNIYLLSNLLKIAVFIPVLLSISISLKQLLLGWNHKKNYVYGTYLSVTITLASFIFVLPYFKVYGVFYTLIATEVFIILFYLLCIRKNWFAKPN